VAGEFSHREKTRSGPFPNVFIGEALEGLGYFEIAKV
jgi:hypothetical protein